MKTILNTILLRLFPKQVLEKFIVVIENYYIKKIGSRKEAEAFFKENNLNPLNEFKKELNPEILIQIIKPIFRAKNITDIINNIQSLKHNKAIDKVEVLKSIEVLETIKEDVKENFNLYQNRFDVSIIPFLENKLQLSLSKTRKELGIPDQRTFNKWLAVFFQDKYANRGKKNGKITFKEYIEIVNAFMLSFNEEKLGDASFNELQDRFTNEKLIHRKELKEYTKKSYALLRAELEDFAEIENLMLPENYRKIPYSIVDLFKNKYIKNEV